MVNDKNVIQRRLEKEKKQVLLFQQRVADAKTARDMLQNEINQVRKDLELALRKEDEQKKIALGLNKKVEVKERAIVREQGGQRLR